MRHTIADITTAADRLIAGVAAIRLAALTAIAALILAVPLATGAAHADERIRVGTYRHYPPWTISDSAGNITGFEIDLIHDLCRRMAVACEITAVDWEHIFDALDAGEFDLYIGAMTVTPERAKRVTFTRPYALTPEYFATTTGNELTSLLTLNRLDLDSMTPEERATLSSLIEALRGKRLGVHVETVYETFAKAYLTGVADIRIYHSEVEQYADMIHGKLDAVLDGGAALHEFILANTTGQPLALFGPALTGGPFGHGNGGAVRLGNETLRARVDKAIAAAKADGTMARLALTWFGYNAAAE